jgi:hypothetical protein
MSDDRPSVYLEGNRTVFRASALGGCLRALVAARLGYDPLPFDDASELRMEEGNLHEPAIVEWLTTEGWPVVDQQRLIELTVADTIVIRGHIDGVGRRPGRDDVLVEIKAMGQDPFKRWITDRFTSNERYAWQVSVYMHALGLPGLFVVKNRNTGAVDVTEIDEAPVPLAKIKARAAQIEAIARRGDFPDCDTAYLWNCPYRYLHDQKELPGITGVEAVDDVEVDALAAAYDRARTLATQADTMKKVARDRLADVVRDRKKVRTGRWSVSCSLQKRTTIDMAKLRAEVDVSPYEVASEVETVRVTEAGGAR